MINPKSEGQKYYMKKLHLTVFICVIIFLLSSCQSTPTIVQKEAKNTNYTLKYVLEYDSQFLFLSYYDDIQENNHSCKFLLESYDIKKHEFTYSLSEKDYPKLGNLLRIDKALDITGCDYRMIFEKGVVYRNHNDINMEYVQQFNNIMPTNFDEIQGYGNVDLNKNNIVYATDDAVWLTDRDGSNQIRIIDSTILSNKFPDIPDGLLANPRFIDENRKIIIGVYQTLSYEFTGALVYNIQDNEVEFTIDVVLPDAVVYPINDQYIISKSLANTRNMKILDVTNGITNDYSLESDSRTRIESFDYQTIIVIKYNRSVDRLCAYICNPSNLNDESKRLFETDQYLQYLGITEHYIFFTDDNKNIAFVKYQ